MKSKSLRAALIGLLLTALAFAGRAGESCSACLAPKLPDQPAATTVANTTAPAAEPGHPLRGVIVDLLPKQQALLVNHEEIPGVMRAMTMVLKVDAPTLAAAKKGQEITASLVRKTDGWWLENVQPIAP